MIRSLFMLLFLLVSVQSFGTPVDSTALIFSDNAVHSYEIRFTQANWQDSLLYNKQDNGESYMMGKFVYRTPNGDSIILDSVGVRYKGNSSFTMAKTPKKSIKISFDEYVKGRTFFGCEKLNLNNCIEDPSYMREKLGYDLIRRYMPTPRAAYANLSINGALIGVYSQVEQVDKAFLERNFDKADGSLFKAGDNGVGLDYKGPNVDAYSALYELKSNDDDANAWNHFITMLYKLNDTLSGDPVKKVSSHLNFTNSIQHLAWTIILSHFDSYTGSGRNFYLYDDPKSGKFVFIPWDVNMAFGQLPYTWDVLTNSPFKIANLDLRPVNKCIIANDSLKNIYISCLRDMLNGPFNPDSIAVEATRIKAIIEPHIKLEPEANKFYTTQQFMDNVEKDLVLGSGFSTITIPGIKTFAAARAAELHKQINAGVIPGRESKVKVQKSLLSFSFNRTASIMTLQCPIAGKPLSVCTVFDGNGRVVNQIRPSAATFSLSTSSLCAGVYIIGVANEFETVSQRVFITK